MKGLFLTVVLITAILISCGSVPPSAEIPGPAALTANEITKNEVIVNEVKGSEMTVNELEGKEWQLTQVRINGVNIGFDRSDIARSGYTTAFTLSFETELLGGVGAPNRYSAPYSLKTGNQITISLIRATLMAPLREMDKLREHDYFSYLQNTASWNFVNNNLELYSKDADGKAVVLIFSM
jgi:heat shock protein HslJ